ncbi:MAG: thiol:disulfide interchange protein DsbA/DsbL [Polaromonas sp.]|uniref:thiol:disulfide interchange protein DsbA/DsbL n=1 Tax=Polaromonas sp. TaxID=1869339 RepID=UPI00272F08DA|nr:thiol:disulfide interchange protein DsbA/DsbL [Polaromonas sp.]MDP1740039.1 thiol:disulfide interchange protein DsbA/DsbL [Polaromonas sp.]MDP1954589.1 thiol:disulfide interchange protein DsbA/DsbL [Polaromonas sp.]MDP3356360.1 thiol:disulfide interchange protein DsbA/DsbL [Polaromonas sp.]MDP3752280.1 thiol:disulfide interchange protein DsbA/DsbL [Polaromonas sp.]
MQRREFSVSAAALAAASAGAWTLPAQAQGAPRAGTDYLVLDKRAAVEAPDGKIEVVEFFWYSCVHCNRFEPALEEWIKKAPKDVVVRRVPIAFRPDFEPQQRLYYVLETMNKVEELQKKVFHAIHVEKQILNTPELIAAWVEKQGIDKAKFTELYNSFSVATKARKATQLQDAYKVDGVPALGIAGRFYTSGSLAQTMERALQVTDYLVGQVRKG